MVLVGVVCVGPHNEIGINNHCCYRIPEDRAFFQALITNQTVIVGHKTYESIPKHILQLCKHVVVLTHTNCDIQEYINSTDNVYVIGGAQTYKSLEQYTQTYYITHVDKPTQADRYFTVDMTPYVHKEVIMCHDDWKIIKYTK